MSGLVCWYGLTLKAGVRNFVPAEMLTCRRVGCSEPVAPRVTLSPSLWLSAGPVLSSEATHTPCPVARTGPSLRAGYFSRGI